MPTPAQVEANRINAQLSTGPVTDEGKQRSSLNSLSHGFYSKHLLLPTEDPAELNLLRAELIDAYAPANAAETLLVERIISCQWKLRRLQQLESAAMQNLTKQHQVEQMQNLLTMEQRLDSMLHKAIRALRDMQRTRNQNVRNEPNSEPKPVPAKPLHPAEIDLLQQLNHIIATPHLSLATRQTRSTKSTGRNEGPTPLSPVRRGEEG